MTYYKSARKLSRPNFPMYCWLRLFLHMKEEGKKKQTVLR